MKVAGVCGTDLKITSGKWDTITVPVIPGHEIAGEVVELGRGVTDLQVGDRVVFNCYITCGHCKNCLAGREMVCMNSIRRLGFECNGGFADYMVGPAKNAVKIPDGVSYRHAAVTPDAISVSVHAFHDRVRPVPGDNVLIIGAGGLGMHGLQVAKAMGANVTIADIDDAKLETAKKLGADHTINTKKVDMVAACMELTGGYGMDVVGEFVGQPETSEAGMASVRYGGAMVFIGYSPGVPFSAQSFDFHRKELAVIGSRAISNKNIADGLEMVKRGQVKPQIDAEFSLEQINEVLDRLKIGGFLGRAILIVDPGL